MFSPVKEYNNITGWADTLIGKELLLRSFTSQLSRFLNRNGHPVKVKTIRNNQDLDSDDFTFGATYDCVLDELGSKPIRINFIINHHRLIPWKITKKISRQLSLDLVETLAHEYQHLHQYRARNYRVIKHSFPGGEEQEYLSHPDEIDAYSTNIAVRQYINKHLLNITNYKKHLDLTTYYKAFGKNHKIVTELEEQILAKMTNMEK
jgi:hypothetical protein